MGNNSQPDNKLKPDDSDNSDSTVQNADYSEKIWICTECNSQNDTMDTSYRCKCASCNIQFLDQFNPLTRNDKQIIIVNGFCRIYLNYLSLPTDITQTIIKYMDVYQLFTDIFCTKNDNKYDGNVSTNKINIDNIFYDDIDILKCINCFNKNCLIFIESYKQTPCKLIGYKNNINKYKCNICNYYNIYNVKINLLKYVEHEKEGDVFDIDGETYEIEIDYVSPFKFIPNNNFKAHTITSENIKPKYCPICNNNSFINIIGSDAQYVDDPKQISVIRSGVATIRNIFHCDQCSLYILKTREIHSSEYCK